MRAIGAVRAIGTVGALRRISGLLLLLGVACDPASEPTSAVAPAAVGPAPPVVLITLESLRTDHVGAYGGRSRTRPEIALTPTLDALAAEAVVYENAHSVTSWTLSSHASLFTGLYPSAHGTRGPLARLSDDHTTLAERLAAGGYQTGAVVSGPYLRSPHNLTQGFGWVDDSSANPLHPRAHSDVTNPGMEAALIRFVELERDAERPFFLFAYFWDPHFDFLPPAPFDRMFVAGPERVDMHDFETSDAVHPGLAPAEIDYVLSQYDGEIRATDELLGRFFGLLRQRGLWDEALVIVTADHGEEFFDHGEKGHKKNLFQETVRVPLIVKYPKGVGPPGGTRDDRLVSLVDVVPTVLALAGLDAAEPAHGASLLAAPDPDRAIYFQLLSSWYTQRLGNTIADIDDWAGVRVGDRKLVRNERSTELFDLAADPAERSDLSQDPAAGAAELERRLDRALGRFERDGEAFAPGGEAELGDEATERLCALGYLDC